MNSRKVSVLGGIAVLAVSIVISWFLASGSTSQADREPPTEIIRVPTLQAEPGSVTNRIYFTGRVIPEERFDIYSEVTGVLIAGSKPFKTGIAIKKGEPIVQMNDDELTQQLEAARYEFSALLSQVLPDINIDYPEAYNDWQAYLSAFNATQSLPSLPEVDNRQLRLFLNSRNVYSRYSAIRRQEVRLSKFTIRAPFDGVITESQLSPGALVQPNQRLGEFTKLHPLEIEASIPAEQSRFIKVGDTIDIAFENSTISSITTRIDRKNEKIDPASQSVKIFMKITGEELRPGAYVEGNIKGAELEDAVRIHQDVLVRDSEIFEIRDSTATLKSVQVLSQQGDSATITGVEPGTVIIDDFREPAFEGSKVAPLGDR